MHAKQSWIRMLDIHFYIEPNLIIFQLSNSVLRTS
jgi:hypothetical protein